MHVLPLRAAQVATAVFLSTQLGGCSLRHDLITGMGSCTSALEAGHARHVGLLYTVWGKSTARCTYSKPDQVQPLVGKGTCICQRSARGLEACEAKSRLRSLASFLSTTQRVCCPLPKYDLHHNHHSIGHDEGHCRHKDVTHDHLLRGTANQQLKAAHLEGMLLHVQDL